MPQTIFIGIGILAAIIGLLVWISSVSELRKIEAGTSRKDDEAYTFGKWTGIIMFFVGTILALVLLLANSFVSNGIGEAKVYTNPDGTIQDTQLEPGFYTKAPWIEYQDFDLFSQEVLYAGGGDGGPSYSGGTVNGQEVTIAVGGVSGGSTQGNVDISITYSIDAESVKDIYSKYRNQERFTKQVIEKTILSTIRQVPSAYTAVEFRGEKRQEASDKILDSLNAKFSKLGVDVDFVNIQDVRYPAEVENALKEVETANQKILKAEADQRTAEVEAQTLIIEKQGQADANAIVTESLTPEVLQKAYIDALNKANTIYVVPGNTTPFLQVK